MEAIRKTDDFTFEVILRKILKREESVIRIWIRNDPEDQSDDADAIAQEVHPLRSHALLR